jgi:hypothetical protein
MSNLLADPRARDLLAAQPFEVSAIADGFRLVSIEAGDIATGLRGAQNDASWTGEAATAFRAKVGQLPGQLDKVHESFGDAAAALDTYEPDLAGLQTQFRSIVSQLQDAQTSASTLSTQLSADRSNLSTAKSAKGASSSTPAVQSAQTAVSSTTSALSQANSDVTGLESQGYRILGEFETARDTCCSRISQAGSIAPHESFWDHLLGDVGNWMGDIGHFFEGIALGIYHGVEGLPGAFVNFVEHPSWATFGKFAEDLAITASVAALIVMPFDAPEVAAFVDAMETTSALASRGAALADAMQGKWADAAVALAFGKLPEGGDVLGVGEDAAEAAEANVQVISNYEDMLMSGASPEEAMAGMTADERQAIMDQVYTETEPGYYSLGDPTEALEAAEASAGNAARMARLVGRPLSFAVEQGLYDPAEKATDNKVSEVLHGHPDSGD